MNGRKINVSIGALAVLGLLAVMASEALAARPVLLIYGFQPIPGFRTAQLWEDFAEHFSGNDVANTQSISISGDHQFYMLPSIDADHRDVFMSNYALSFEPTTRDIFVYTARLADEVRVMRSQFGVTEYDVVGHSMGGLIARTYAEIDDFRASSGAEGIGPKDIEYDGGMRTLVLLATPNHGTQVALLGEWFSTLSRQLAPGSTYLRILNATQWGGGRVTSLNPSVRYISIAGQTCLGCGMRVDRNACLTTCAQAGLAWEGSDLVVMMQSAYLPDAENCAAIGLDHVAIHTNDVVCSAIDAALSGHAIPDAIYAPELAEIALSASSTSSSPTSPPE